MPNETNSLTIKTNGQNSSATFLPTGELINGKATDKLREKMTNKILSGITQLKVDFTEVTAIDAALITALVRTKQRLRLGGNGGRLILTGMAKEFVEFFDKSGYKAIFNL